MNTSENGISNTNQYEKKIPVMTRGLFQADVMRYIEKENTGIPLVDLFLDESEGGHGYGKKASLIIDDSRNIKIQDILLNQTKEQWSEIIPMVVYMMQHDIFLEEDYQKLHEEAA